MSVINNNLLLTAAAGGATAGRSVRFNSADSAHLSRTPASAGNRKTWTWSGWVKRCKLAVSDFELFSADPDQIRFSDDNGGNSIRIITTGSSVVTSQLFRDASAWYHIVVAIDTTQATASNRIKLYVNGSQVTSFFSATYPAQNADTTINSAVAHNIGALNGSYGFFDGYLALVHFIDGQALTPSSFGETSATTGRWEAKTYAGSYSGNSFFLDFLDNSAATATTLGKDSSGLGNNWVPNNIQATVPSNSVTLPASNAPSSVEYLVVGGGGGGGSNYAGGGGGGGFRTGTLSVTAGATYSVQVGLGGAGATTANSNGANGTDSIFSSITSIGGGGGGGAGGPAAGNGGSGGGSVSQARGLGTAGQGNNGAQGSSSGDGGGGGGGGAGAAGTAGAPYLGGAGGAGSSSSITGTSVTYAGGGGGGTEGTDPGVGGSGGGGRGGYGGSNKGINGTANSGGGGGGGGGSAVPGRNGGNGGSGIVVIKYANTYADLTIGGGLTYTSANTGGYKIYTITASSTATAAGIDSLCDHPTSAGTNTQLGGEVSGNYCTWNPLFLNSGYTLSNGNLDIAGSLANVIGSVATMSMQSGKWYWEVTVNNIGSNPGDVDVGIVNNSITLSEGTVGLTSGFGWRSNGGFRLGAATANISGVSYTTGDVLSFALDVTTLNFWIGKNGSWLSSGNPATGANPAGAMNSSSNFFAAIRPYGTGTSFSLNTGQRAWAYTCPAGFSPLVDTLLPTPVVAKPNTVMDVALYTGNGSGANTFLSTGPTVSTGFSPDLVWIKSRSLAKSHVIHDTVRGETKRLYSDLTNGEFTYDHNKLAFNSNGIQITTNDDNYNNNNSTYAAWLWDAGTSTVTNTQGSITSQVRANASAGFSIVTYTGTGSNATVGHGLGAGVGMLIIKNRNSANEWVVGHAGITLGSGRLYLNTTDANDTAGASALWNSTAATSSVFSVGTNSKVNSSGGTYVAYVFSPVAGYSSMGSYVASSGLPFVYLGFRPRFLLIKNITTASTNWRIIDSARDTYNDGSGAYWLKANTSDAEVDERPVDFLSNGFKLRMTDAGDLNYSSDTYIYFAVAENPFAYARAR